MQLLFVFLLRPKNLTVLFTTTEFPVQFPPHPLPEVAQAHKRHSTVMAVQQKNVAVVELAATDESQDRLKKEK
jgi:hypothetical protein